MKFGEFPRYALILCAAAAALAGCGSPREAFDGIYPAPSSVTPSGVGRPPAAQQSVYWALFYARADPQLQIAAAPLSKKSHINEVDGTAGNMLEQSSCVRFYKGFAWILTGPNGSGEPNELLIFDLPLKTSSRPLYYDTLEGGTFDVHMEFDKRGDLWVSSLGQKQGNNAVIEYASDDDFFQEGAAIQPSLTLTSGISGPQGLAFDRNGNLYVADGGASNIAVFAQPIQNQQPYYLAGITNPGGLAFDANGNLYAASNEGSTGAMLEYDKGHLRSGDKPSVVDPTGINADPYGSDLAFDKAGNLYDGDCGSTAGIYTYPLSTQKFTKKLAPSFYTNKTILQIGCIWGLDLH